MKRSSTKQKIRQAEKRLAIRVEECLTHWDAANDDWREGTLENFGQWITHLLGFHVQLDYTWSRDRWLDGIEDMAVSIEAPNVLCVKGKLIWGLLSNIGGRQTTESFQGTIFLTGVKRRPLAYTLSVGDQERHHFSMGV